MNNKRSSRRSKPKGNHITRANNILVFKLVDPICQSLLLIFLIYCMDSDTDIQYQTILDVIVGWQILSCVANFLIKSPDSLKKQRTSFLVTMIAYLGLSYLIEKNVTEKIIVMRQVNNLKIPLYDSILQVGTMILVFWYFVICFKEIRALLTSVTKDAS